MDKKSIDRLKVVQKGIENWLEFRKEDSCDYKPTWLNFIDQVLWDEKYEKEEEEGINTGWRPMDIAPKDGTPILLSFGDEWRATKIERDIRQRDHCPQVCWWNPRYIYWESWKGEHEVDDPKGWMEIP